MQLDKRMRDNALVAGSAAQELSQQVDQAIALTADLVSAGEVADEEMRQARAAAGMSATAIRNLHSRVVSTLQPDSTLKVRSRITCLAYMHRNACFLRAQSIRADRGDFRKYILECVKVIGERIADLVAITGGYAAWKARTLMSPCELPKQQCCARCRLAAGARGKAAERR